MEVVPYGGWSRCARLVAGDTELLVTLEVGPRIIRYGRIGGPNMLVEYTKDMGKTGGDEYRSYGGHRLWVAPEHKVTTYEPDNSPVDVLEVPSGLHFTTPLGRERIQKQIEITVDGNAFVLHHTLTNRQDHLISIAAWSLTVMATGGTCIIPQADYFPHPDALLPARPLVLWHYTQMQDPRYTWGNHLIRLQQSATGGPTKLGALVQQGYAAYANFGDLFFKRFPFEEGADYLDYGVNFETFTRPDMLEVESVGPRTHLAPGESTSLRETWYLVADQTPPEDDTAAGQWLAGIARPRPMR